MADELTPEFDSVFYYACCPECGLDFAVGSELKKDDVYGALVAVTDDDIVKILCPLCGERFPLVIERALEVFLAVNEYRVTQRRKSLR